MSDRFSNISLQDSILIKGWAILLIVLHNYFHLIYKVTKENEMDFDPGRFAALATETLADPSHWAHGLLTYFGHLGVQVFIFLSAYGMTKAHGDASSEKWNFFLSRLKKIYPTFFLAVGLWLASTAAWDIVLLGASLQDVLQNMLDRIYDAAKVALGIHNFFPGHGYPKVGPWWFIPFIIQFYLLWALLGNKLIDLSQRAMFAAGLAGIAFNYTAVPLVFGAADVNLLYTPLGHVPEIMLGVYWAKYGFTLSRAIVAGALVVFVLSSLYQYAYPLHHISALVLLLWSAFAVLSIDSSAISKSLLILGIYSMPLFLVNGFLRPPFLKVSRNFDAWYVDILAAVVLVFVALGVAIVIGKTEKFLVGRTGGR